MKKDVVVTMIVTALFCYAAFVTVLVSRITV